MTSEELTPRERRQLDILLMVHDRPTITGIWRKTDCERLEELGLAEVRHYGGSTTYGGGLTIYSITEKGIELARSLRT